MPDLTVEEKAAKLAEATRLLAEVNEAERDDAQLNWRPWRLTREKSWR